MFSNEITIPDITARYVVLRSAFSAFGCEGNVLDLQLRFKSKTDYRLVDSALRLTSDDSRRIMRASGKRLKNQSQF